MVINPGHINLVPGLSAPRRTKSITKAELDYIRDGGGAEGGWRCAREKEARRLTKADWKLVFHLHKLIGVYLGQLLP